MKRFICFLPWLFAASAVAQSFQLDQSAMLYSTSTSGTNYERGVNYRSLRGVPVSNVTNAPPNPIGSDGRGFATQTPNQFMGLLPLGGVVRPTSPANLVNNGTTTNYSQNAVNIGLPRATNGSAQVVLVLRSSQLCPSFFSRPIAFLFGSVITPPTTDENGAPIATNLQASYWQPQPFTNSIFTNAAYYWSPHAGAVFANQAGPIQIVWKRAAPGTATPTNSLTLGSNYVVEAGNVFRLTNTTYIVSGSAFKTPRKIYWTEGVFRQTGKPVTVPTARVGAVNVVYNQAFPRTVPTGYVAPGQSSPNEGQTNAALSELRTLWFDSTQGQIQAYNQEGRVFVELLGDALGGNIRQHLGYEIVDVYQQVTPADITVELGEKITAYADGRDDSELISEPVLSQVATAQPFLYDQNAATGARAERYAARETLNQNDVLVHWLEESVAGLRWPLIYARYQQVWPADVAKYSHYVRPLVATEAEAKLTAVPLPNANVPTIQWQDPLDQERGGLTENFAYYTFLTPEQPVHRALLRFSSGDLIRFERVFSWLNESLITTNFSGTLATNLTTVADYVNYNNYLATAAAYSNYSSYTNYLVARTRGVNVNWQLYVSDDASGDSGSISSWTMVVETTNSGAGTLATNQFTNTGGISIPSFGNATPYPSLITVSGITNAVTAVRVKLNGYSHTYPNDVVAYLTGPQSGQSYLMYRVGGNDPGVSGINLVFDDAASSTISTTNPVSGTYRPPGSLAALLLSAPAVVSAPPQPWVTNAPAVVTPPPLALNPFPNDFISPRVVSQTVEVGKRIVAPSGETGDTGDSYLAGYILQAKGNSFHPTAYQNPLVSGFDAANLGAIIPVNAIPGANALEVWWFRGNSVSTDNTKLAQGFKGIYWPTVIGRYTIQWPVAPDEIVLASNDGSGGLESLQAAGSIYVQNDPALPGYNPNEEHGLMLGGQAYALRDDLNLMANTTPAVLSGSGATYSSQPFVLLDYTESDGRPAVRPFKVLREKPSAGIVFDYIVTAGGNANNSGGGSPLQAPMPLPFLPAPVGYVTNITTSFHFQLFGWLDFYLPSLTPITNIVAVNYNTEPSGNSGDLPVGWTPDQASKIYGNYARFTFKDRKDSFWVMRGMHAGLPAFQAGSYNTNTEAFSTNLTAATAVVGQPFTNVFHTSRQTDATALTLLSGTLPSGLSLNGVTLAGIPNAAGSNFLTFAVTDKGDNATVTNTLSLIVATNGTVVAQGPLVIVSTNKYALANATYVDRPPFLAAPPDGSNSFTMRFYYKTQAGFAWPGILPTNQPAIGSIVPYLRPANSTADPRAKTTPSLDIVYRPVWPSDPPKMAFGQTLTDPKNKLPAVRGQSSVQLLYQQSIGQNITGAPPAVVLHDPTSEKSFALKTNATDGLAKLPDGVKTELYQGKTYFPNLPPHLAKRFFYDPNVGPKGSLVFQGEFKDEVLGEKYLLLNVLRGTDLATVKGLCPASDPKKTDWNNAVDALRATVVTKYENPLVPGQFVVNTDLNETKGIGELIEIKDSQTAVDSYALSASGPGQGYVTMLVGNSGNPDQTPSGEPVSLYVFKLTGTLYPGELKVLPSDNPLNEFVSFQHTVDLAGRFDEYDYEWKINPPVDGFPPVVDATMSRYQPLVSGLSLPGYTLGGSGVQALVDNYVVIRYRPKNTNHPLYNVWSDWTVPALAEGWIKRVLAGINPFNQRVTDLYNNTVNTDANILTSAGRRYEGDIALNLANINNYGLIEIYETVLKRGRNLSINAGINFGPANDALLLAAGYLSDLYMLVGNEAYADASNPTIGIGTKDNTYGDIATSLFAFKGQMLSLLEEELALLRGRDDVAQPGVTVTPVYNRLIWNYTRGIDAGEVIYALNYNILDQNTDGTVNAADAAKLYPQGHGDAYGHYLTAFKGYYSLLMNKDFDWVPRVEAVNILGKPVTVDYLDERKFATAAAAAARTGRQIFDLTWRKDYLPGKDMGWERFSTIRVSPRTAVNGTATNNIVRHWGADQWASRTGQGALLNWLVGNAILPAVDPNPSHEGIQKIDRTTVPELKELATTLDDLQTALDNAEGRLTPLGLAEGSLAFDINPNNVVGANPQTHFEQIYDRAKAALNNAVASFDDAKDVTRLMRSEQDSLEDYQTSVAQQELAYTNALIELYGTPYADDIGTGKTYKQGFEGPDLLHYMYVDDVTLYEKYNGLWAPNDEDTFVIDIQALAPDWGSTLGINNWLVPALITGPDGTEIDNPAYSNGVHFITYPWGPHGFLGKPSDWTGKRKSPGKIQQAISEIIAAHDNLYVTITANAMSDAEDLFKQVRLLESRGVSLNNIRILEALARITQNESTRRGNNAAITSQYYQLDAGIADDIGQVTGEFYPKNLIFVLAAGGDTFAPGRGATILTAKALKHVFLAADLINNSIYLTGETERQKLLLELQRQIDELGRTEEFKQAIVELGAAVKQVQGDFILINQALRRLDDATRQGMSLVASGDRIQAERLVFRQRAAAVIQGYRTRDAAFRIFRNEKLERYKSLFDLSSRYAYLAATAYDYETGLLGTDAGKSFVNRIVNSRALGVVRNGEPQYAGSNTGDPGLSSAMAEMKADWDVLKGRLGFNNPDAYGTTASLRTGMLRILPGSDGDSKWQDVLQEGRKDNLLDDADVRRHCLQIDTGDGLPVPGIVLTFSTTIAPGQNLFGRPTAAGDVNFEVSAFATKIFGVGVALEGYRGMQDPVANGTAVSGSGGVSPADPTLSYLDPLALNGTPSVYLIPVGVDSMRSPPLGDTSDIRTWNVEDVAIPLPFNIGASDFSTRSLYQSADSLTEPLFSVRKHQSFRPVSTTTAFSSSIYTGSGGLQRSQFSNNRLIGRSAWNSQWKIVIPGNRLLDDPKEGLARFIKTVTDVKLHFITYSYSGN